MLPADPAVAGDAQQGQCHLEWHPLADRVEGAVPVWEVASILPQEMPDKRLGGIFVARRFQENMLQLPGDAPNIEDPLGPFHAFQANSRHLPTAAHQKISRG